MEKGMKEDIRRCIIQLKSREEAGCMAAAYAAAYAAGWLSKYPELAELLDTIAKSK